MRRVMAMSLALMLAMPAVAQDQIGGGETEIGNGTASYYGRELAGNRTASGERFDPDQMTAAHPTLAFGSKVRVTNLSNGQSVIVRVNDRGPFGGRRVIDISQAAAKEIGMHRSGTARVSLTLVADQD
ncbi:MAG TPA: septal ring lytic transglycosylase RlpA family protein [Sphingopyxis terrae]|jgi:rare lipoprotein A|uniref:septal ring lytic transglycosylase RlpA family protein n=1 Tax=uncultured Sphingopyxis sp. TaxID=310581 RepID=UPI000B22A0BF|nr:septal ring lytic transglycosylase RlpA family protein [uncultured Sphingopyxis sp.]HRE34686.1 septal ring lytic transglycosylase RlpA family protein [Sphingopyxis terrae]